MVKNLTAVVASCRWSGADNVKPRPGEKRPCRGGMHAVINDRTPPSCGCGFPVAAGHYCTAGAVNRTAAKCYGARFRSWVFVLVSGSNVLNSLTPTIVISPCRSVLSYPVSLQYAYTHPRPMFQSVQLASRDQQGAAKPIGLANYTAVLGWGPFPARCKRDLRFH